MAATDVTPPRSGSLADVARDIVRSIMRLVGQIVAVVCAIIVGVLSSRAMIADGSMLSTNSYGPWVHWSGIGLDDADPYTRAHIAKFATLRLAAHSAGVYEADSDSLGARLHSSCDYVIEGPDTGGMWWSLSVFDSTGALIANDAERYSFTRDTVASNPDGSYIVTLGRDARPGNWLPTSGAGRLMLVFTVLDPATGLSGEERVERNKLVPEIRREGCS